MIFGLNIEEDMFWIKRRDLNDLDILQLRIFATNIADLGLKSSAYISNTPFESARYYQDIVDIDH